MMKVIGRKSVDAFMYIVTLSYSLTILFFFGTFRPCERIRFRGGHHELTYCQLAVAIASNVKYLKCMLFSIYLPSQFHKHHNNKATTDERYEVCIA